MNKKFFIVTAIVLAVAAGLAASAMAQGRHGRFAHHDGWMLRHMTKELNLTDAQQGQIKTILQAEKTKIQPLMKQLHDSRLAENSNVTGNFDEAQARTVANQQAQIMSNLIVEKARTKSQIYAVLTPDQRAKALQLMQERQQRRQQHMHKSLPQTQATPSQ
jgi:Spy/CpxP family protein refolding chaperone